MTLFFSSDHHFGQGGARGLFKRPFESVAEMDATMIRRWNETVGPKDLVWYLGDFALYKDTNRTAELLGALHGEKHLIAGNNDPGSVRELGAWSSVQEFIEFQLGDDYLVLCHYPLRSWNRQSKKAWQLHGHSHGRMKPLTRQVDVGVDVWEFRPVSLDEIRAARARKAPTSRARARSAEK